MLLLNANERNIKLRVKIKISMVNPLKPPIFVINLYTVSPVESDSEIEGYSRPKIKRFTHEAISIRTHEADFQIFINSGVTFLPKRAHGLMTVVVMQADETEWNKPSSLLASLHVRPSPACFQFAWFAWSFMATCHSPFPWSLIFNKIMLSFFLLTNNFYNFHDFLKGFKISVNLFS